MYDKRKLIGAFLLAGFFLALQPAHAQNRSAFAGVRNAFDYAYGVVQPVQALVLDGGPYATGSVTFTVQFGATTAADGTAFAPLSTNAPILLDQGSNQETVTPSAVSCSTPQIYDTCTFTATVSNVHGRGANIASATYGLSEAVNISFNPMGISGVVAISPGWAQAGGTNATIATVNPYASVMLQDNRSPNHHMWSMQPTTLTSLAVPTTLTSTTAAFSGTGTWNGTYYICVTYVDGLGGEGPCSATYNGASGTNTSLTITAPAASTGAVGWRAYAGASYNAAYLLPITSASCGITGIETVIPACSMGSNGTWAAVNLTTTTLRPNGQTPTVNLNLPMPQGHTTFAYAPTNSTPVPFQSNYGPFPAFGSTTSAQTDVIGSWNMPLAFLNVIGRTLRISGKIAVTANTAAVPTVTIGLGWVAGLTAGAPIAVCTNTGAAYGASAAFNIAFSCTLTVNATGSAAATIMTDGTLIYTAAAGGTGAVANDTGTAAIGSLGLTQQNTAYVEYTSGTNTSSAVQLLDLHVEVLQ